MKFINGNWLPAEHFQLGYSCNIFDYNISEDRLVFYLSEHPSTDRHTAVSLAYNTETITSPMEGVLKVNLYHFAGGTGLQPSFAVRENPPSAADQEVSYDEASQTFSFRTGELEMKAHRSDPFRIAYYGGGRLLTSSGERSSGYMTNTQTGQAYMAEELALNVGDLVYGTGERFTPFVKNGQVVDLWNQDGGSGTWQAYKNIPFYLTSSGYGVFINTPGKVSLEIETQRNFRVGISVPGEELEYFIIYGKDPKGVLEKYTALTGRAPRIPAWSFGLWLSTSFTTNYDEKTVTSMLNGMKERNIPLSVFHFDCFWMHENEWCNFTWDERCFPDPEAMLERYHKRGLRICVWINPYIGQKSYLFREGAEHGYLLMRSNGRIWQDDDWQSGKSIVDFTNPEAVKWYQSKLRALLDMGVDAFKTDFGERIPTDVVWFDHSDPERMHNYYTFLYNKAVFEVIRKVRGEGEAVVFARSATSGSQQFPVHWGGDSYSNYSSMAETLRAGLSFGLSGFGFWSHDIGGFEQTSTADVYKRWVQFGLLSSHSRLHGSQSYRVPWAYDEEASRVLKFFVNLKLRLMPYLYAAAKEVSDHGWPVLRAMVLEFPDDPNCRTLDKQYMLGDSLLVAPIFNDQGIGTYYLPEGRWVHLLSGQVHEGGRWYRETYDYFSLPLFVRPGSILPIGAADDTAEYDYDDGVTFRLFPTGTDAPLEKSFTLTLCDGSRAGTMKVRFEGHRIHYSYDNPNSRPFSIEAGGKMYQNPAPEGDLEV